jgi:pilus assembly protein CpaC
MRTHCEKGGKPIGQPRWWVLLVIPFLWVAALPAAQQLAPLAPQQPAPAPAEVPPQAAAPAQLPQTLHVIVDHSLVITSPTPIRRISIANPDIAEAVVINPFQVLINGKKPGAVSLILWSATGQSQSFDVNVDMDILALSQKIHEVFASEPVHIEASKDVVMLSGQVSSAEVADKIYSVVKAEVPKVISLMQVPTPPARGEVLLQVKFAEVDQSALNQFGFNIFSLPGTTTRTAGTIGTGQFGPLATSSLTTPTAGSGTSAGFTNFTVSDLLNLFIFRPDINMGLTLKALQQKNLLQILAEPNLLTETGKEASFLAGGEFPFPVVQGGAAGSVPTVTIQFREFGVRLNFTPTITADNMVHLKVTPEVSTLDFTNALTISGFLVPAISTRRVSTEMLLKDGQSFAIAGLMDNRVQQQLNKIPWIGDLPILGRLFRSHSLTKSKSELLVLVTPHIVQPTTAPMAGPPGPKFPLPFLAPVTPAPAQPIPPAPK